MSPRLAGGNLYFKKPPFNHPDGSGFSLQQLNALCVFVSNEIKIYADSLSDVEIVPRAKWRFFQAERDMLVTQNARSTKELEVKAQPAFAPAPRLPQVQPLPEPEPESESIVEEDHSLLNALSEDVSFEYSASSDDEEKGEAFPKREKLSFWNAEVLINDSMRFAEECIENLIFTRKL